MISNTFVGSCDPKIYWPISRINFSCYSTRVDLYCHQIRLFIIPCSLVTCYLDQYTFVLYWTLWATFTKIIWIKIPHFLSSILHFKMLSAKCLQICAGINVSKSGICEEKVKHLTMTEILTHLFGNHYLNQWWPSLLSLNGLAHFGIVMTYNDIDLGQHWLRQ